MTKLLNSWIVTQLPTTMLIFLYSLLLPAMPCLVHCQLMDELGRAMMLSLGHTNPALIIDQEVNPAWSSWQSSVIIPATSDQDDIEMVVSNLERLLRMDEIDFIFFMTPTETKHFSSLVDRIGSLWPTITMLLPHEYPVSYPLRLDSRLFFYKISGPSVALFEKYQIR